MKKVFVLYDGRAKHGVDNDDCAVLCTARSEPEAWRDSVTFREVDAIWFEYDLQEKPKRLAINEKARPDIGKGILL